MAHSGPTAASSEEHDLAREFGHAYEEYRRRVPMLVPFAGARRQARGQHEATV